MVQKGLDGGDLSAQVNLANRITALIQTTIEETDFAVLEVNQRAEQLFDLLDETGSRLAMGKVATYLIHPETSVAHSFLFTGAIHEPQMYTELKKKIVSVDRIDMLASSVKWSGLRLIMDELREFIRGSGILR